MTPTRRAAAGLLLFAALLAGCATPGAAPPPPPVAPSEVALLEEPVEFRDGDTVLEGLLVRDPSLAGPRPGVMVVHEWWGLGEHAREAARRLARLGYVAFAADMYGKGLFTDDPAKAGEWAGQFRGAGLARGRARARANLEILRAAPGVDPSRLAVMGFCFGGTVAIETAWSGADVRAVVSFHGSPTSPSDAEGPGVRASVLYLHGNADPLVKEEGLLALRQAVEKHGIDAAFVFYSGAEHSFTNPAANRPGARYHATAAARAWQAMEAFLAERLGGAPR